MKIYKGVGGQIELSDTAVTIKRKGFLGFVTQGLKGEKRIPFASIGAVQFKKAGITSGYIQFSIVGGNEARGGVFDAAKDENTVMFTMKQQAEFAELRDLVDTRIAASRAPTVIQQSAASVADELTKLAALRDQGVLSEEEFNGQKAVLLTRS